MKKRKVPGLLLNRARQVEKDLPEFETIDRYIVRTILEAGQHGVPVDGAILKAAKRILIQNGNEHYQDSAA